MLHCSIRSRSPPSRGSCSSDVDGSGGSPALRASQKAYVVCVGAANHLVSIGTVKRLQSLRWPLTDGLGILAHVYAEHYDINRCPVFFTYYVFTASIMHVTICESKEILIGGMPLTYLKYWTTPTTFRPPLIFVKQWRY